MRGRRMARSWRWVILGLMLVPIGGCGVIVDVLNPGLLVDLGLDPATIIPQPGTVIVAFHNTTPYTATFFAYESVDTVDLSQSSHNFSTVVGADEVKNEVLECPVGQIAPGSLAADFTPDTLAAAVRVVTADQQTQTVELVDVEYAGDPLVSGIAFTCGDLVELRLVVATTAADNQGGTQQQFRMVVQVIPGR